jgi:dephospho-CoA kinase
MAAPAPKPMLGLLGGIGSGKSRVAAALARHGGRVIQADELGHQALRQPEIRRRAVERWGPALLDNQGEIVRSRLAAIVFADPAELRALEDMVHPWIGQAIQREADRLRADPQVRFLILDAAVMLEAGWHALCDNLIFVETPRPLRLERLLRQRGWTAQEVQARENAQMPLTAKAEKADHVLENSGTPEQLDRHVTDLLGRWGLICPDPRPLLTEDPF